MSIDRYIDFNPLTTAPDTLLKDAVKSISQKRSRDRSSCLLIVIAKELAGILTQSDVVRLVATGTNFAVTTVGEVMTKPVLTRLRSQCCDFDLMRCFFEQHSVSHLVLVNENRELIGAIEDRALIQLPLPDLQEKQTADRESDLQKKTESERFLDLTPSLVCIAGLDGYFKRVNPAFQKKLGFTEAEILAKPFIELVHPEDRSATIAEVEQLTAGKTTISFENRYLTKDGNYRCLLWTAKLDRLDRAIFCIGLDITERKQEIAVLEESHQQFKLLAQKAPVGIFQTDAVGNCLYVNSRWQQMAGLSDSGADSLTEAIDKSVYSLINPQHRQALIELTARIFEGKSGKLEFELTGLKGRSRWLETNAVPLRKGNEIVALLAVTRDITQRKHAELQLQQERDFSKAVIDTVGTLVAVLDRQGAIVSFNHTCERITGYSFAEVKNKTVWDFLIPTEEKMVVKAIFKKLLTGQFHERYENCWVAKDGSQSLISWSNTALFDAAGNIEFIIATGIDVTEQRRIWNKLEFQYRQTKLLTEITDKIRMSIALDEILQTTVDEVQHLLACDRVLIVEIRANNRAFPISEAIIADLPPMLGYELADPLLIGEYLARYHRGKVLAIDNIATAAIDSDIKQLLKQFQIQAKLVVPILAQGELKGLLIAHQCHNPRQWQESEIQLLNQLADRLGVALSQAQLFDYAERLVSERTRELTVTNELLQLEIAERKQTERDLRENQSKLAGILDNADEAIISIDERQQIQLFNQGAEKIFGYQASEIIGKPLDILLPEVFRLVHRHHIDNFGKAKGTFSQDDRT